MDRHGTLIGQKDNIIQFKLSDLHVAKTLTLNVIFLQKYLSYGGEYLNESLINIYVQQLQH